MSHDRAIARILGIEEVVEEVGDFGNGFAGFVPEMGSILVAAVQMPLHGRDAFAGIAIGVEASKMAKCLQMQCGVPLVRLIASINSGKAREVLFVSNAQRNLKSFFALSS